MAHWREVLQGADGCWGRRVGLPRDHRRHPACRLAHSLADHASTHYLRRCGCSIPPLPPAPVGFLLTIRPCHQAPSPPPTHTHHPLPPASPRHACLPPFLSPPRSRASATWRAARWTWPPLALTTSATAPASCTSRRPTSSRTACSSASASSAAASTSCPSSTTTSAAAEPGGGSGGVGVGAERVRVWVGWCWGEGAMGRGAKPEVDWGKSPGCGHACRERCDQRYVVSIALTQTPRRPRNSLDSTPQATQPQPAAAQAHGGADG